MRIANHADQVLCAFVNGCARAAVAQVIFDGPMEFGSDVILDVVRDLAPHIFATDYYSQKAGQN
jgi:hypothetical protein